jgi:CubicO group peptidase (beta-lactamase class C family)
MCVLLFILAFNFNGYGQSSFSQRPDRSALRQERSVTSTKGAPPTVGTELLTGSASLDSFFVAYMATYHYPGLAACIIKNNRVAWQGYYGFANLARTIPITDSTIFMIASISKTFTCTALMQLYEAGRFQLDDSVNRYLPFPVRNPNHPSIPITFRMLLTHTSSIQDNWNAMTTVGGDYPMPLGTYLQKYLAPGGQYYSPGLSFYSYAPGTTWNYSNIGTSLCAYLVETISGIPFEQYCRDSIFVPLQMTSTAWFLSDLNTSLIARPYTYSYGSYIDNGLYGMPYYPAAQLRTTLASLARFLMANIDGGELGGARILDTATIGIMRTAYLTAVSWNYTFMEQGLLWEFTTDINGRPLWGKVGQFYGVSTSMFLLQSDGIGAIILANGTPSTDKDWDPGIRRLMAEADTLTVGVQRVCLPIPEDCRLLQNYPNPFNPSTTIRYELPHASRVSLKIYNVLGQEVATLVNETKPAGVYTAQFDAGSLASAVYFYRLQAGDFVSTKRMLVLK